MKKRINISVSPDTELLLKTYAKEHHTTVSQAITDWIWSEKEKSSYCCWAKEEKCLKDLKEADIKYLKAVGKYEKYCEAVDELLRKEKK